MIDQLEHTLRETLRDRAAEVPAAATTRLRGRDYHPRAYRVRPRIAVSAAAGTAGVATAAVLAIGLGAGASNAFAGWTPSPTAAPGDQTANAVANCRRQLEQAPAPPAGVKLAAPGSLQPVLTDTRGPFTVVIFAGGNSTQSCINGPSFTSLSSSTGGDTTATDAHVQLSGIHFTARDGHPYALVEGHVGNDVTAATLVLSDGARVKATTDNGWFTAWWPGSQNVTAAEVSTPTGLRTQHFSTHGPIECGSGACSGTISGSGSGSEKGSGMMSSSIRTGGGFGGSSRGPVTSSVTKP